MNVKWGMQNMSMDELAAKLMHDVYAHFTACIWLDDAGQVLDLYQFDTLYCKPKWSAPFGAAQCILISNHPDGCMNPLRCDKKNLCSLKEEVPSVSCKLLIYAEDEGLCEINEKERTAG